MNEKNRNIALKNYAIKYLSKFSDTRSLSKLEEVISNKKGTRLQYVTAGYLYYNKDCIDKLKFPTLNKIRDDFEKAKNENNELDPYWKVFNTYNVQLNRRKKNNDSKEIARNEIIKIIEANNIKYSSISHAVNIDNSSLRKFIKEKKLSDLSLSNATKVLRLLRENYG